MRDNSTVPESVSEADRRWPRLPDSNRRPPTACQEATDRNGESVADVGGESLNACIVLGYN